MPAHDPQVDSQLLQPDNRPMKAIIFDCFGVVISDTIGLHIQNASATDPAKAARIMSLCVALDKGQISLDTGHSEIAAELDMTLEAYRQQIHAGEVKNEPLLAYILTLRPTYKIGLLSNINGGGLAERFTPQELELYFDTAIASGDIGVVKPDAEAYHITADRLGVPAEECVMIDDRQDFCDGARAAGMQAIQFTSVTQLKTDLESLLSYSS